MRAKTEYRIERVIITLFLLVFSFLWIPWLVIITGDLFSNAFVVLVVSMIVMIISLALVLWLSIRWYDPYERKLKERIKIEEEQKSEVIARTADAAGLVKHPDPIL